MHLAPATAGQVRVGVVDRNETTDAGLLQEGSIGPGGILVVPPGAPPPALPLINAA